MLDRLPSSRRHVGHSAQHEYREDRHPVWGGKMGRSNCRCNSRWDSEVQAHLAFWITEVVQGCRCWLLTVHLLNHRIGPPSRCPCQGVCLLTSVSSSTLDNNHWLVLDRDASVHVCSPHWRLAHAALCTTSVRNSSDYRSQGTRTHLHGYEWPLFQPWREVEVANSVFALFYSWNQRQGRSPLASASAPICCHSM